MSSVSERLGGIAARTIEFPRELQAVGLVLVDGTEIRGVLHRAHGTCILDFLNRQSESFLPMTDAILVKGDHVEHVPFVAINKAHVVRLVEARQD